MNIFHLTLILATLLCSLVAGFVYAFAVVVMPGIKRLSDQEFVRAFQEMDGVIQRSAPLFVVVWLGSVVALIVALALGVVATDGLTRLLLVGATVIYLFGVQLPTFRINIPLNSRIQKLDAATLDEESLKVARDEFEPRWVRWNTIRTGLAILASAMLMVVLVML